jgi:guanylate kinase
VEHQPLLIVISGPAGVGKDALVRSVRERGQPFHFVVTATDRPPRAGEVDGVDYHFLTRREFSRMIEEDELLEHAVVYGQNKGVPRQQVREALRSGLDVVMRVDVQGASTMQQLVPAAVFIFLMASSERELEARLRGRGGDSEKQIRRRLAAAHEEMASVSSFDYVVINRNGKLSEAVDDVLAIIRAEHRRVDQRRITV